MHLILYAAPNLHMQTQHGSRVHTAGFLLLFCAAAGPAGCHYVNTAAELKGFAYTWLGIIDTAWDICALTGLVL